jgi:hypothetical protein
MTSRLGQDLSIISALVPSILHIYFPPINLSLLSLPLLYLPLLYLPLLYLPLLYLHLLGLLLLYLPLLCLPLHYLPLLYLHLLYLPYLKLVESLEEKKSEESKIYRERGFQIGIKA